MPNLDKLAYGGIRLNQSYVQSTCTPTRTALLTGRYPFTLGLQKGVINPLDPRGVPLSATLLPQELKKLGYSTHVIGKWHLGFCNWAYTPTNRGFDTFYGFYTGSEDHYTHRRKGTLDKDCQCFRKANTCGTPGLDLRNNTEPDFTKDGIYSSDLFASVAEDLLRLRNPKNPMFLYLPFQSVHEPLQVPAKYIKAYTDIKNRKRRIFLAMVTAMDDAVGRVIDALKATGHYENSIIIFTNDNGGPLKFGASNWPLRGGKNNLWEGGTKATAFVHSPLLSNNRAVSNQLLHVTDWFPTIVAMAGGKGSNIVDGFNQWDALKGLESPPRKTMIYNIDNTDDFHASIRMNDFKMSVGKMGNKDWVSSPVRKPKARKFSGTESSNDTTNREFVNRFKEFNLNGNRARKKKSDRDFITWRKLKRHPLINLDRKVTKTLNAYMTFKTEIRLYNITDDPEERHELSPTNKIVELVPMLTYLSQQMPRYVQIEYGNLKCKGLPSNWNGVWSPGWCKAM